MTARMLEKRISGESFNDSYGTQSFFTYLLAKIVGTQRYLSSYYNGTNMDRLITDTIGKDGAEELLNGRVEDSIVALLNILESKGLSITQLNAQAEDEMGTTTQVEPIRNESGKIEGYVSDTDHSLKGLSVNAYWKKATYPDWMKGHPIIYFIEDGLASSWEQLEKTLRSEAHPSMGNAAYQIRRLSTEDPNWASGISIRINISEFLKDQIQAYRIAPDEERPVLRRAIQADIKDLIDSAIIRAEAIALEEFNKVNAHIDEMDLEL